LALRKQLEHAGDAHHRRADLMAHRGEERRFGLVRRGRSRFALDEISLVGEQVAAHRDQGIIDLTELAARLELVRLHECRIANMARKTHEATDASVYIAQYAASDDHDEEQRADTYKDAQP